MKTTFQTKTFRIDMDDTRPKPEEILARLKDEELEPTKARLKIFLGMAPGVGKTYTMLEAARKLVDDGVDVIAGCVVTHGRKDTEALLENLESVPYHQVEYRGRSMDEFDIDRVLKRKPNMVLVDELAHSNVPGSRHEKRWQDVEELLNAGINVFTTVNVQHLESANDIVAQITGIHVRETVPDSIFELAYEVELVDLPPDDLIQRLREGKVYLPPEQSKAALENFFRKGNLIALRELALRATAERVDAQMEKYRRDSSVSEIWPASDRVLVCVGPHPLSSRLVRATRRMATAMHSEWIAVFVETPKTVRLKQRDRDRVMQTLRLAERLGGETAILSGQSTAEEIITYARQRNVSRIVIGKPSQPRWRELLFGSIVDDVIRGSGNVDVYVITGDKGKPETVKLEPAHQPFLLRDYCNAIGLVAVATLISKLGFNTLAQVNLAMFFMLAVVITALNWGRGPSILSAVLSVGAFDFFFVPPYYSFAVTDTQYLISFVVMIVVGLTLSTMTSTVKRQMEISRNRERHTATLYSMTRDLAAAVGAERVVAAAVSHITEFFDCQVSIHLADSSGELRQFQNVQPTFDIDAKELGVVQWVFLNRQMAGIGTATLPGAKALYLPLIGSQGIIGVIGILPSEPQRLQNPEEMHLLEIFVNQLALAVERANLSVEATKAKLANGHASGKMDVNRN